MRLGYDDLSSKLSVMTIIICYFHLHLNNHFLSQKITSQSSFLTTYPKTFTPFFPHASTQITQDIDAYLLQIHNFPSIHKKLFSSQLLLMLDFFQ